MSSGVSTSTIAGYVLQFRFAVGVSFFLAAPSRPTRTRLESSSSSTAGHRFDLVSTHALHPPVVIAPAVVQGSFPPLERRSAQTSDTRCPAGRSHVSGAP